MSSSTLCYLYSDYLHLHSFPTRRSSDLRNEKYTFFLCKLHPSGKEAFPDYQEPNLLGSKFPVLPNTDRLDPLTALVDRKSTRLNSSHVRISYAVFCLKKKLLSL